MTRRGLISCSTSGPSPHFSSMPGRKFSTRPSAAAHRRLIRSDPRRSRRFAVISFLLRARSGHHRPLPLYLVLAPDPHRIGAVGRFDLDDLGAEIGETAADEGPRQHLADLDDAEPRERTLARRGRGAVARGFRRFVEHSSFLPKSPWVSVWRTSRAACCRTGSSAPCRRRHGRRPPSSRPPLPAPLSRWEWSGAAR